MRPAALLLPLLTLLPACGASPPAQPAGDDDSYSVVLAGHLYSLYVATKTERRDPVIGFRSPVQAFAEELARIDPRRVFLLGDSVRYGFEEEWTFLEESLAELGERVVFVPGNHEYRDFEAFRRHGGVANETFVIGRNKFVVLDARTWMTEADLAFIEGAVADHERYDHVFVLTHLFMAPWPLPAGGEDPGTGGRMSVVRESNWTRDVLPLIAGKVDAVFCGDTHDYHVRNVVQEHPDGDVTYVLNGFRFGRGHDADQSGDGPMLFLELRFSGSGYEIVPRAVPLDARAPWYRHFQRLPEDEAAPWQRHRLGDSGITIALPGEWSVAPATGGPELRAVLWEEEPARRVDLEVGPVGSTETGFEELAGVWQRELLGAHPVLALDGEGQTSVGGRPALWTTVLGIVDGRRVYRWSVLVTVEGRGYALTLTMPRNQLGRHVETMARIARDVGFETPADE
jgi:hypothetical protein